MEKRRNRAEKRKAKQEKLWRLADSSLNIQVYRSRKSSQKLKLNFKGWIRFRATQEMSEREASRMNY